MHVPSARRRLSFRRSHCTYRLATVQRACGPSCNSLPVQLHRKVLGHSVRSRPLPFPTSDRSRGGQFVRRQTKSLGFRAGRVISCGKAARLPAASPRFRVLGAGPGGPLRSLSLMSYSIFTPPRCRHLRSHSHRYDPLPLANRGMNRLNCSII